MENKKKLNKFEVQCLEKLSSQLFSMTVITALEKHGIIDRCGIQICSPFADRENLLSAAAVVAGIHKYFCDSNNNPRNLP